MSRSRSANRFRPLLDALEARDVPAALSFKLPDGSAGSALFSTPAGVDPAQSWQQIELAGLTVSKGGVAYDIAPVPFAYYANGVLVGVAATAYSDTDQIDLSISTATYSVYGSPDYETVPITYDAADTKATFTLPDGTVGAISYAVPWDQVDPTQASQSLTPTAFNLNIAGQNIAGQNIAVGSASYTTAPTLQFAYGELTGVNFAVDTSVAPGFAFSSISMTGLNVTAVVTGTGQQILAPVDVKVTMLSFDFSQIQPAAYDYSLTVTVSYADGTNKSVTFTVETGTTGGGLRDMMVTALKSVGVDAKAVDGNRMIVEGTADKNVSFVKFEAPKQAVTAAKPSIVDLKLAGRLSIADLRPNWDVKVVNP